MSDLDSRLYFKTLGPGRRAIYGGRGQWPEVGVWTDPRRVIPYISGWYMARPRELLSWLAPEIYLARGEGVVVRGEWVVAERAVLVQRLPWDDRVAQLFSCDCAERALNLYGGEVDPRSRDAVSVGRLFAVGKATLKELSAAHAAANAAAWPAAWSAARSAEHRWQIKHLMETYLGVNLEDDA